MEKEFNIPKPTLSRLCEVYNALGELENRNVQSVSSSDLGKMTGHTASSLRKDLTYVKEFESTGAKYNVVNLKKHLGIELNLNVFRRACIVGLGRLGKAILNYNNFTKNGFDIVAGFDSSVNTIETLVTNVKLYPAYQIEEKIKELEIELAIIAVPANAAQTSADRLIEGGIKGIVNFAPVYINVPSEKVFVKTIDVVKEFRLLSALISMA